HEAQRIGLLSLVVEKDSLDKSVDDLLAHLLAGGPEALAKIKDLVRTVSNQELDDALVAETAKRIAEIRVSPEGKEGIASFLEKRKPAWSSKKS
ncbi:MAG TPA: enoyl-CoA hydratase-related protein, partial [Burkholderiales bacterium]|nr:enoyl-CoA hydratase-related protein [Burkholderiales bacterium]